MTFEELNPDFKDILLLLADAGAEFLVVGAYALAFHGAPRASGDIDIFVRPSAENAAKVFRALLDFGAPVASANLTMGDLAMAGTVYQIGLPPRRIDILTEISGVHFDRAWAGRRMTEVEGRQIAVIGRQEFLDNKEAAGRPKDLADASRLRRLPVT